MVDVGKVSGPGGPTGPVPGKEPSKIEADKFKKYVEETDTEQKKKQKKPQKDIEELEEEAEEVVAARPQTPDRSPADLKFPKGPIIKEVGKSDERQKKQEKRPEEAPPETKVEEASPKKAERKEPAQPFKVKEPSTAKTEKAAEGAVPPKPPEPLSELTEAEGIAPPPPAPPPPQPIAEEKEEEKTVAKKMPSQPRAFSQPKKADEKKAHTPKEPVLPSAQTSPGPFFLPPPAPVAPGYASMKPEVFQLFERMVMAITVMHESGATETTIHLNSPDFTIFAGAQIVIREYSTAPRAYNVEFLGNAQNTALFSASAQDLVAGINTANYNFKINRIESSLLSSERPLFHRKEKPGQKGEKDSQGDLK